MDKRYFHNYLNKLKDSNPNDFALIESIQDTFETTVDCISDDQRKALRNYPIQYIDRIPQEDGGWTTNLHTWAENGLPELIDIDPMILGHKNGYGDTVLMALVVGATGAHTEVVNYKLIQKILETDLNYDDVERDADKDTITQVNVLDIEDLNGESVLDYLLNFAYATGTYEGQEPDEKLQMLLKYFAQYEEDEPEEDEPEVKVIVHEQPTVEKENPVELQENNEDLDLKNHVSTNSSSIISSTVD